MTADRTKTGPESGEAQLGSAGPSRPPAADKAEAKPGSKAALEAEVRRLSAKVDGLAAKIGATA